jgi:hypothetical protein
MQESSAAEQFAVKRDPTGTTILEWTSHLEKILEEVLPTSSGPRELIQAYILDKPGVLWLLMHVQTLLLRGATATNQRLSLILQFSLDIMHRDMSTKKKQEEQSRMANLVCQLIPWFGKAGILPSCLDKDRDQDDNKPIDSIFCLAQYVAAKSGIAIHLRRSMLHSIIEHVSSQYPKGQPGLGRFVPSLNCGYGLEYGLDRVPRFLRVVWSSGFAARGFPLREQAILEAPIEMLTRKQRQQRRYRGRHPHKFKLPKVSDWLKTGATAPVL